MRKLPILLALVAGLFATQANADVTGKDAAAATVTWFDFVCFTTKHCPSHVTINSAGTEIFTAAAPGQVTGANGTFPATQSGTWTVNPTTAANWGIGANGSANPANSQQLGMSDGTNLQKWLAAIALADGVNGNNTGAVAAWLYNGTTYDRARGDTTSGAWVNVKTSALPTGSSTSANQASQIAQETATAAMLGTTADAVCSSATGTCTLASLIKYLNNAAGSATPAGTNTIGNVGSDPSSGKGTPASAAINVSTATTTQLVALSGTTKIYVTSYDVIAGGTGNITFVYGTGASCGTGTTSLTGAYNLAAQAGIAKGNGLGAVLIVPAGNALCVTTSAAVQMSGSVSYQQF